MYTIVTLKAMSDEAIATLENPANKRRVVESQSPILSLGLRSRREDTPPVEIRAVKICLSLRKRDQPFNPQKGFVFGSDSQNDQVDILLNHDRGIEGVSRMHFAINFDWIDNSLFIQNLSRLGTILESGLSEMRLMNNEREKISSGDYIRAGYVVLQVHIPQRIKTDTYFKHLKQYRKDYNDATPRLEAVVEPDSSVRTKHESEYLSPMRVLGSGRYGDVLQSVSVSGAYFATKLFKSKELNAAIKREIKILSQIDHPNIVRIYNDKLVETKWPYVVMEFLEFGTLYEQDKLSIFQIDVVFQQLCSGVEFLHSCHVAHRDLKPQNILVKSLCPVHITIADFGFASEDELESICGTYSFAAPEIYSKKTYTSSVDVWSIGIIMLLFSSSARIPAEPKAHNWNIELWSENVQKWKQETPIHGLEHFVDLAREILIFDPTQRKEIKQVVDKVNYHIKSIVRGFIKEDQTQHFPKVICLTDLLDYMSLDKAIIGRIAAKGLRKTHSYKVQRPNSAHIGRKRDVYVGLGYALEVVSEQAPLLIKLVAEVVKEAEGSIDK